MNPRPVTDADVRYRDSAEGIDVVAVRTFTAPSDPDNCTPCQAIVTSSEGHHVVRVPWVLTDDEVMQLMVTNTLWLSTWHGLPAHMIEVHPMVAE